MTSDMENHLSEIEELRARNRELEETLDAIRFGEVDAIVVSREQRRQVYTLEGADHPYRVLVENIREGALTLAETGMILYANTAFAVMRRQTLSNILGTSLRDQIVPRDRGRFDALLQASLGGPARDELHICSGTSSFPVLVSMSPMEVDGSLKLSVVVSDRKEDADRLRLLARMLDSVVDAVTAVDPGGTIIYWNEAAEHMFGWQASEMAGRTLADTIAPGMRAEEERRVFEELAAGETWCGEYEARHRDGRSFPVLATRAPVYDEDGRLVAIIGTSHDISERKRAEEELRRRAEELEAVTDLAPAAIWVGHDRGCISITGNRLANEFYEAEPGENVSAGRPPPEAPSPRVFRDPDGRELAAEELPMQVAAAKNQAVPDAEFVVDLPSGRRRHLLGSAVPLREPDGSVRGAVAAFLDVTERRGFERALAESEERFRLAQEGAAIGVWDWDVLTGRQTYTAEIPRLYGVEGAALEQVDIWRRYIHPDDRERVERERDAALAAKAPFAVEFRVVRPSGEVRWLSGTGRGYYDDRGTLVRVIGTNLDITERKEAEEELRQSREWFRAMGETLPYGVWRANAHGGAEYVSQSFLDLLEMTQEEQREFGWTHRLPPDEVEPMLKRWLHCIETGEDWDDEHHVLGPDGVYHTVLTRGRPVRDRNGEIVAWVGINLDIDDRKRAEEDMRRSNEELQRFAYVASHDLQEPLRSIVSFSQLLARRYRGKLDQDADDYIAFIVEGGIRMQTLIQDLLQVSRVETGAKPLEPTDAVDVAYDALLALEASIRASGAIVTVGDLPAVMADRSQLEQVFANLVGNAIKYRRDDVQPEIRIEGRRVGPMVEFAVRDNGIGIEAEYFDRIFEMFRRLHTHDEYEGTGIGLAVVKKIIGRHGGRIRVDSTPGEGSTFYFTLPAA